MSAFIISEARHARPELVGAKAWNLFLLQRDFAVPEFCVLTTEAFREFQKHGGMQRELEHELNEVLQRFLKKGAIAIRSSGTAEDLSKASFAGMYTTMLNVTTVGDALAAIIDTWKSCDSARVKKYCEAMKIPHGDMAVIIQHQLKPDISGVMLTQSPFSVKEVLIECCRGTGEKLVSGMLTPTRYRIRRDTVKKEGEDVLTDAQRVHLVDIGKRIEEQFHGPQDIEWALENEQYYILQSRPVTVQAAVPRRPCTVWTNANVRETIPDPISPLCWSIFDGVFFPYLFTDVFRFPITKEQYYRFRPVELVSGRLYWNVNNTMAFAKPVEPFLRLVEGSTAIDPQFAAAFDAVDTKKLPAVVPGLTMYVFSIISLVRLGYYLGLGFFRYGWMARKIAVIQEGFHELSERLTPVKDLSQGLRNIQAWFEIILKRFTRQYFGSIVLSTFYLALLSKLLRYRMGGQGNVVARKTIVGILDTTGEMVLAVRNLAAYARQKLNQVTIGALKQLYESDEKFHTHFEQFLHDFGHRGPAEFDIASLNWREDPDRVFSLIMTAQHASVHDIDRARIIRDILKQAKPYERFMLKVFIPRIEAFTPFRENGKHVYFKLGSRIKDQILSIADVFQEQGYLEQKRDIFFLTLGDITDITNNTVTPAVILERIRIRKEQWHTYRSAAAPDIVYETGERITASVRASKVLSAESLSFGKIVARARLIRNFDESGKLQQGEILVTHHTDPGWTPLFTVCSGVIIEVGGLICHAAMVARELGIPTVVLRGATSLIPDGALIELNADEGYVSVDTASTDNTGTHTLP